MSLAALLRQQADRRESRAVGEQRFAMAAWRRRKRLAARVECSRCGGIGHLPKDCPLPISDRDSKLAAPTNPTENP